MGAAKAAPPLMTLRDLLELSCESSCSEGFRTYPRRLPWHADAQLRAKAAEEDAAAPVRLLIEADLRRSPSRTLSSILFPRSPRSLATVSRLTRSLSRRLVFWRRHRGDDAGGSDSDERDSLGLPSPVVSSCSASECAAESVAEAADLLADAGQHESGASDHSEKPSPSTSSGIAGSLNDTDDGAAAGDGHKALDGDHPVESMEDKQQLSPVSVLDFPFHDEDEDEDEDEDDGDERSDAGTCSCSPSFLHCQPDLQRSNSVLHKIRRLDLDGLAPQAGVDPRADLEPRFSASDDSGSGASASDDTQQAQSESSSSAATTTKTSTAPSCDDEQHPIPDDAERESDLRHRLLARVLKDQDGSLATSDDVATERLLLDFFAEGLDRGRSPKAGPVVGTVKPSDHDQDDAALVRAAKEWVHGLGARWGVEDVLFAGPVALADMDRERRWACVGEEQREVGATVEWLLMDALVAELVRDMAAGRC